MWQSHGISDEELRSSTAKLRQRPHKKAQDINLAAFKNIAAFKRKKAIFLPVYLNDIWGKEEMNMPL